MQPRFAGRILGISFRRALPFPPWLEYPMRECDSEAARFREGHLNQKVKNLIQKLGEAIHESVSESEDIAVVVRSIREQGFDVLLMLEATIGLNEVESEDDETATEGEGELSGPFTPHDLNFLKSLRISVAEDGEPLTEDGSNPTE